MQKRGEEQSRNATVRGFSKGIEGDKTHYELELSVSGHSTDVLIDPSGEVVEVEEEVALPSLPPKVSEGLQKKAGSGKIVKVESLRKRGILVAYEPRCGLATDIVRCRWGLKARLWRIRSECAGSGRGTNWGQ